MRKEYTFKTYLKEVLSEAIRQLAIFITIATPIICLSYIFGLVARYYGIVSVVNHHTETTSEIIGSGFCFLLYFLFAVLALTLIAIKIVQSIASDFRFKRMQYRIKTNSHNYKTCSVQTDTAIAYRAVALGLESAKSDSEVDHKC